MENFIKPIITDDVLEFIESLPIKDQDKILGSIGAFSKRQFDAVYVKQIFGEIKELRVRRYRLLFFVANDSVHFMRIFVKKTNKTPKREIELAIKYFRSFKNLK